MLDANKTALTHKITAVASAYLDMRGFKPIETEVRVADKWVADIASFVYPSMTGLRNLKIIPNKWCQDPTAEEIDYRYSYPLTAIIEVKASLLDFKKDINTKFSGQVYPAHLCYLAYPSGMIDKTEIPRGWIGLEAADDGGRVINIHRPFRLITPHSQKPGDVTDLIAAVAIRRDYRTRYAAQRAFVKAYNAQERKTQRDRNVKGVLWDLMKYLQGDLFFDGRDFDQFLKWHNINKVPQYMQPMKEFFDQARSHK